jgi:hypothetical protein
MLHVPVAVAVTVKVGEAGCTVIGATDATPAHVFVCENEPA